MRKQFPDQYPAYRKRVKRIIPFILEFRQVGTVLALRLQIGRGWRGQWLTAEKIDYSPERSEASLEWTPGNAA